MFFLYHLSTSPTGRLLAKALGIRYGHLGVQPDVRLRRRLRRANAATKLIRWGSSEAINNWCPTLNSAEAIRTAADKLATLQCLHEAEVPVPQFTTDPDEAFAWDTTVLARRRHGSQGRDIRVFQPGERPFGGQLYTRYVPNTREYRLHVFQGEVIRTQGKYLDLPEEHTNPYIKNHGQGFRFRTPDVQLNADRIQAATGAVAALGLDFGAVDLLIGEDRRCYVLEVNSAPSCAPMTARAYVEKFAAWLGIEPNLEVLNGQEPGIRTARPHEDAHRAERPLAYV